MHNCQKNSWITAGILGLLTMIYLMSAKDYGFFGALFWGLVLVVVAGFLIIFLFCNTRPHEASTTTVNTPAPASAIKSTAASEFPAASSSASTPAPAATNPVSGESIVTPAPDESAPEASTAETVTSPEILSEPRNGQADDLKKIKGVGPKLETVLNGLGFYHFDQIAAWGDQEIAWVDQQLGNFSGRVSRDDWIGQARTLAAGGTTDFSN